MSAIDLQGFSAKFADSDDPWATFSAHDEAVKRDAIVHALGGRPWGRVLELASGNGSNSVKLAARARRLDATEGTPEGTELTARALDGARGTRASVLALPGRFPRPTYDAIVVAELLYYLSPRAMAAVARDVAAAARPGTLLVLAHHRVDFYDFAQHSHGIHDRFLREAGRFGAPRMVRRTGKWLVEAAVAR